MNTDNQIYTLKRGLQQLMSLPIIAIDLDGTLLKDDKTVSNFTIETLRNLSEAGAHIFFTTGRRERIGITVLKSFDFKSWAIYNNGMIATNWPSRQRIFSNYIPKNLIVDVIRCLKEINRPPILLIDSKSGEQDILMDSSLMSIDVYREYSEIHKEFTIIEGFEPSNIIKIYNNLNKVFSYDEKIQK